MFKKARIKAYVKKCERCGMRIHGPKFSMFNATVTFKKYAGICGKCIRPEEIKEIDKEIDERMRKHENN